MTVKSAQEFVSKYPDLFWNVSVLTPVPSRLSSNIEALAQSLTGTGIWVRSIDVKTGKFNIEMYNGSGK